MATAEQSVCRKAEELGFCSIGFSPAAPTGKFEAFRYWLASGQAGEMAGYLRKTLNIRSDPRLLAPGAQTVISAAMAYPQPDSPGRGFSTLSRCHDYHDVIRGQLGILASFLKSGHNAKTCRICVDSAPLPERAYAAASGIGWIGRQGQLVSPRAGACLVLGEIITDLEFTPSNPVPDGCGSCTACVEACPSSAINPDRTINATKCAAYLTIEHRSPFSRVESANAGQNIFGCDICTSVCPWNNRRTCPPGITPYCHPVPTASECVNLQEDRFREIFHGTTVYRSGIQRLKRNAGNAMLNGLPPNHP